MTAPTHVYVTAHGSFSAGPWVGESAQFGLRLPLVPVISAPDKGALFTPLSNGDAVLDNGTATGTHGTLTRTFTFRIGESGSTENWDAAFQTDIAEDVWTFLDAVKIYNRSNFRWTHVKQAAVSATGVTLHHSSVYTFDTPIVGSSTGMLPPQCALAVSLRTPVIGRRGRGRIYLPAVASTCVDADGTISAGVGTNLRTWAKALVDNLQDPPGTPTAIPIVSIMSADSATAYRPLEVRTGNRIDTIRSRREQVAETYTALDL